MEVLNLIITPIVLIAKALICGIAIGGFVLLLTEQITNKIKGL